jgi:hypothetical protein
MALIKQMTLSTGVTIEYWRISNLCRSLVADTIVVEGFLNKSTRDEKKLSLTKKVFKMTNALSIDACYAHLKTQPFFSGATDA